MSSTANAMSRQSRVCGRRSEAVGIDETAPGLGERPRAEAAPDYRTGSLMRLKRMQKQSWLLHIVPIHRLVRSGRLIPYRLTETPRSSPDATEITSTRDVQIMDG